MARAPIEPPTAFSFNGSQTIPSGLSLSKIRAAAPADCLNCCSGDSKSATAGLPAAQWNSASGRAPEQNTPHLLRAGEEGITMLFPSQVGQHLHPHAPVQKRQINESFALFH